MGIRFYCPNGHKLNVKEFQAGRRGICPFCGARTQIPTQSTRPSGKARRRAGGQSAGQQAGHDDDDGQGSDSSPDILPGEPPSLPGDPGYLLAGAPAQWVGGKMLGPSTAPDSPAAGPVAAPPAAGARSTGFSRNEAGNPPKGGTTSAAALAARQQPKAPPPSAPFPSVADVLAASSAPARTPAPGTPPEARVETAAPPLPPTPVAGAPAPTPEPPDPIAEAPEMIWYIRPPSGGQFGPAPGELMRTWMSEGRVSADSLIWREGWRDWQEAGTVFPKLRGNQLMDLLETTTAAPTAGHPGHPQSGSAAHAHRPKTGRSADRSQVTLLAVLILLVVVLAFVFIFVLTR